MIIPNACRALVVYIPVWRPDPLPEGVRELDEDGDEIPPLIPLEEYTAAVWISMDSNFRLRRRYPAVDWHSAVSAETRENDIAAVPERGESYTNMDLKMAEGLRELRYPLFIDYSINCVCFHSCQCACHEGSLVAKL
ncbi:hypothetical protein DFH06DRAFT_1320555 [Mycena polygramma]|nr:hypothetical protein DFH06DRAFT_1320555 [Mycena polygramma]